MTYEKSCGAVVYKRTSGIPLFLIEHMAAGHTSIPKGHVEDGETEEQTAIREIKEETNLDVRLDTRFRHTISYNPYPDIHKDVVFFLAEAASDTLINQECEVSALEWLSYDDAYNAMTYETDKETLKAAKEYMEGELPMGIKRIIHPAGELIDFETVFEENTTLADPVEKRGHFERVEYATDAYDDGKTYSKFCNVYLPWCYNPEDRERRYNVMYYQHGNTCDPDLFTEPAVKDLLDGMFASGAVEPCILVFTTYYFDVYKDVETRRTTGDVPAGDGGGFTGNPGIAPNFYREVVEDIIPAVELRYNTWLKSGSDEDIRAARDHRGFSGYSRGCVCTWYILHHDFEYFRYYSPMSCMTTAGRKINEEVTEKDVVDYLTAPMKAHPELPFFIYASDGYPNDVQAMIDQLRYVTRDPIFSYGQDPQKNNFFFAVSDFPHNDLYCPYYFYNSLQVLFR